MINGDEYCVIADFEDYKRVMEEVDITYQNQNIWAKMAINNVAGMGKFSSDNTIKQYADEIWHI